jgi:hypothetical protein
VISTGNALRARNSERNAPRCGSGNVCWPVGNSRAKSSLVRKADLSDKWMLGVVRKGAATFSRVA